MLKYWLWLTNLQGVTLRDQTLLLRHFGAADEVYFASTDALTMVDSLSDRAREALQNKELDIAERLLSECFEKDISICTMQDAAYPDRLRGIALPPPVLYSVGRMIDFDTQPTIAVVGTRSATAYGLRTAKRLGYQIGRCGGTVVSGMAKGIDAAAMEGALSAGAPVAGILGCGVDIVYPRENRGLFRDVAQWGCLISEYPPGTQPAPWLFPERNRIISGMSNGVLIVEAPEKSGALITAQDAMEQGRDVFVVPGNIDAPTSAGSNALLRDGAMPAFSGWDVVQQYQGIYPQAVQKRVFDGQKQQVPPAVSEVVQTASREKQNVKQAENNKISIDKGEKSHYSVLNDALSEMTSEEQAIYACLTDAPQPTDEIVDKAGQPAQKVLTVLTRMALKGIVRQHPGKRFSK